MLSISRYEFGRYNSCGIWEDAADKDRKIYKLTLRKAINVRVANSFLNTMFVHLFFFHLVYTEKKFEMIAIFCLI